MRAIKNEIQQEIYISGRDGWYYEEWDEDKDREPLLHKIHRLLFPKKIYFYKRVFRVLGHRKCKLFGTCTCSLDPFPCRGEEILVTGHIPPYNYDRTSWICQDHDTIK